MATATLPEPVRASLPQTCPVPPNAEPAPGLPATGSRRSLYISLALLTAVYGWLVAAPMGRRLWFDELFTFYIAQAPNASRLMEAVNRTDFNPPLIYFLVRLSHALFGASEAVTRLPAMLSFFLGSLGAFLFLRRRIGDWWSIAAILAFWSTPYIRYATLARPYGLLLAFFSLTLLGYDAAIRGPRPKWAVPATAAGCIGMMLSHIFAPLSILPFCAAELARAVRTRRLDWPVWAGLVLPVFIALAYIPAMRGFEKIYFPDDYQASFQQIAYFYARLGMLYILPALAAATIVGFMALPYTRRLGRTFPASRAGKAWLLTALITPALLNLVLMRSGGAFWERYCLTSAFAFYLALVCVLAWATGYRRGSAVVAILAFGAGAFLQPYLSDSQTPYPASLSNSLAGHSGLPIVAGSGLTFLELDRYETQYQSRLFYLVDSKAAFEYAHSTIFENMPLLTKYFPIRSQVSSYDAFVAGHKHFLVLSRRDFLEEWIVNKLCDAGAHIRLRASLTGPSKSFQLFEVSF